MCHSRSEQRRVSKSKVSHQSLETSQGNSVRKGNSATSNASMETEILADPDQDDEDSEPEPEFFEPEDLLALGDRDGAISRLGSGIPPSGGTLEPPGPPSKRGWGACAVGWNTIIEAGELWRILLRRSAATTKRSRRPAREEKKRSWLQAERPRRRKSPSLSGGGCRRRRRGGRPDCGSARPPTATMATKGAGRRKRRGRQEVQSPRGDVVAATALKVLPKAPSSVAAETEPTDTVGKENVVFSRLSTSTRHTGSRSRRRRRRNSSITWGPTGRNRRSSPARAALVR